MGCRCDLKYSTTFKSNRHLSMLESSINTTQSSIHKPTDPELVSHSVTYAHCASGHALRVSEGGFMWQTTLSLQSLLEGEFFADSAFLPVNWLVGGLFQVV
mmetsp:Transcript_31456/g.50339  ORF Transcript_31456/g.50339 Transcript_31456/m.50339 type:complete len:101 (-) Transcript_31456:13-315(-)